MRKFSRQWKSTPHIMKQKRATFVPGSVKFPHQRKDGCIYVDQEVAASLARN
jgi:hypothetical protein